jgi:TRAP-type C4-dicarboxylate transport system permease small subunit
MMQSVAAAADGLARINDALLAACKHLLIAIVGGLALILMAAVVWRYALNNAIPWSEEVSKYLMVWLTFLGAPIALRHASHISIDLLLKVFPPRGQQAFHFVISLIIILTMGIVFWKGVGFTQLGARQVASSINISMLYMYIAVPIGSLLTCLVALEQALRSFVGIGDPALGLQVDESAFADDIRE